MDRTTRKVAVKSTGASAEPPGRSKGSRGPGRDTVSNLIRAAGYLLDEEGYDGLTTTAIAKRSGASTATVYRHFPDKDAVLRALVVQLQSDRVNSLYPYLARFEVEPDWRAPFAQAVRMVWKARLSQPGGRSSRRALQRSPALWEWDLQLTRSVAGKFAATIRRRRPDLSVARAHRAALCAVHSLVAMLDLASVEPRMPHAIVEEAIVGQAAYLALVLDAPPLQQPASRRSTSR